MHGTWYEIFFDSSLKIIFQTKKQQKNRLII